MFNLSLSSGGTTQILTHYNATFGTDLAMVARPVRAGSPIVPSVEMYPIANSTMDLDVIDGLSTAPLSTGYGVNIVLGYNIDGVITGVKVRQATTVLMETGSFPQSWQVVNIDISFAATEWSMLPLFKIANALVYIEFSESTRKLTLHYTDEDDEIIGFDGTHSITQNDFEKLSSILAAYKALKSTNYVTR